MAKILKRPKPGAAGGLALVWLTIIGGIGQETVEATGTVRGNLTVTQEHICTPRHTHAHAQTTYRATNESAGTVVA